MRPSEAANSRTGITKSSNNVYRPPRITPTSLPTTNSSNETVRRTKSSATLSEFVSTELSTAPVPEPSIGSTILDRGRRYRGEKEREIERERKAYEEGNYVRLPKEGKKEKGKRRVGEGYGGEEWRGLGEGAERIVGLTKGRKESRLEKSRKRERDGGRENGREDMGGDKRRRDLGPIIIRTRGSLISMPPTTKKPNVIKLRYTQPSEAENPRSPKAVTSNAISSQQRLDPIGSASATTNSSIPTVNSSASSNAEPRSASLIGQQKDVTLPSSEALHSTSYPSSPSSYSVSTTGSSSTRTMAPSANSANKAPMSMRTIDDVDEAYFSRFMSSECTTFFIGPKRKKFLAHSGLLCDLVPHFKAGPVSPEIHGKEIDPDAFDLFLIWLYRGAKALSKALSKATGKLDTCIHLYALAEKWGCGALQNTTIDATAFWMSADSGIGLPGYVRTLEKTLASYCATSIKKLLAFLQRTIIVAAVTKDVGKADFFGLVGGGNDSDGSQNIMRRLLWESVVMFKELPLDCRHVWAVHVKDYHV
ncbi:MAG: hypothetical protein Q9187_004575 [Circinaria calcarea]